MNKFVGCGLALATCLLTTVASAQSFYLDATNPSNAISLNLSAGSYQIAYDSGAWNPWGNVSGCSSNGQCTDKGWYNAFEFNTTSGETVVWDTIRWQTSDLAQASGQAHSPFTFTLASAQSVQFYIHDNPYSDNLGGIALSVTAVPEPETFAMMLAGLGLIGMICRRRSIAAANA